MRDFDFLGTRDDSWRILEDLLAGTQFSISPSRWYSEPQPDLFTELSPALKQMLGEKPQLYIWSPSFTQQPPVLDRQELGPKAGAYFINIAKGGPGLALVLPACLERNGRTYLNYGQLSYPAQVQDFKTGEWRAAPRELVAGFQAVVKRMRALLTRDGKNWIGHDALRLLRSREAELFRQASGHLE